MAAAVPVVRGMEAAGVEGPVMAMASYGSTLVSALPSAHAVEWKGHRSRAIWERSLTSAFCSTATSAKSSASVSFAQNLRSSKKGMAQKASVSLSSSFWGDGNGDSRLHRRHRSGHSRRTSQGPRSMPSVLARLFGPSISNASKLRVLLLGKDHHEGSLQHPRIYTLTHGDITAKVTLALAREINKAQVMGWYSQLQRDEVVAEWRKTRGEMSLHVHCHIGGTNFLHTLIAKLRFDIFQNELPLVLEAFMHGDSDLFEKHPELQNAPVWVYFHSDVEDYNRVECWGPLVDATKRGLLAQQPDSTDNVKQVVVKIGQQFRGAPVPRSMPSAQARLFGPSIFNASKLRVLLLGKDDHEGPLQHPRIYTLTHSDITANFTLAVAREVNKAQVMGWYSQLQRDEVVAEWRKTQGEMSLHVHCHISGTNFLHTLIAKLRFDIFQYELPLVLEAFMHGDSYLFEKHPELQNAPVWVYFHSDVEDYNRVEYWGPLVDATKRGLLPQQPDATDNVRQVVVKIGHEFPGARVCLIPCDCCSRYPAVIPIPESLNSLLLQSQGKSSHLRKDTPESS